MPGAGARAWSAQEPERIIERPEKALRMSFYPSAVLKEYGTEPQITGVAREEDTRRFSAELAAYQRFGELRCPFVPELLEASPDERWLAVARVPGHSLLDLSQSAQRRLPIRSIVHQINQMNLWLRAHRFGDLESNIKDLILDPEGKLHLVDFEAYAGEAEVRPDEDIYDMLILDILVRIFVRKSRRARLTRQFLRLALGICARRPAKTLRLTLHCLARTRRGAWWVRGLAGIRRRLRRTTPPA